MNALAGIKLPPALPRDEATAAIAAAQAGDVAARNALIQSHMRLVIRCATRYARKIYRLDLIDDLVQAGVMGSRDDGGGQSGLLYAILHYDLTSSLRFSTFAVCCITSALREAHANVAVVSQSETVARRHAQIRAIAWRLSRGGEQPSVEDVQAAFTARGARPPRASAIRLALRGPNEAVALDAETPDEAFDVGAAIDGGRERIALTEALTQLKPHEAAVVRAHWGLGDGEPRTLTELAAEMGVTRQRVQVIKSTALRKLQEILGGRA